MHVGRVQQHQQQQRIHPVHGNPFTETQTRQALHRRDLWLAIFTFLPFSRPASRFQPCIFSIVITEWRTAGKKRKNRGKTSWREHTEKKKKEGIKGKISDGRNSAAKPEAATRRLPRIAQIFEDDEGCNERENSVRRKMFLEARYEPTELVGRRK